MKSNLLPVPCLRLLLLMGFALVRLSAADETVTGNLTVTGSTTIGGILAVAGDIDTESNNFILGTQSGTYGLGTFYQTSGSDGVRWRLNRAAGWLWEVDNSGSVSSSMRLDSTNSLMLYASGTAGVTLNPESKSLALGDAVLYRQSGGTLKTDGAFVVGGSFSSADYAATGAMTAGGAITASSSRIAVGSLGVSDTDTFLTLYPQTAGASIYHISNGNGQLRFTRGAIGSENTHDMTLSANTLVVGAPTNGKTLLGYGTPLMSSTSVSPTLQVFSSSTQGSILLQQAVADFTGPAIYAQKNRSGVFGTYTTATQLNDALFFVAGEGADGVSAMRRGASISFVADGLFSATSSPGKITFNTTLSGGTSTTERMVISNSGVVSVSSNTASTSSTTGALVVAGGLGVGGSLNVQGTISTSGALNSTGHTISNTAPQLILSGAAGNNKFISFKNGAVNRIAIKADSVADDFQIVTFDDSGNYIDAPFRVGRAAGNSVMLTRTVPSTSPTTGSLVVSGGVGVGGNLNVGGTITGSTTGGLTLTAASSGNQSITLTPSGTGSTVLNGNVGIGQTAPTAKLHVTGPDTGNSKAFMVTSSSNTPKFTVLDNGTSYFEGGNVGIGTTTPAAKLEVLGNTRFSAVNSHIVINETDATADNRLYYIDANSGQFRIMAATDSLGSFGNIMLANRSSSTIGSVIFPNGNVGIGATNPISKLQLGSNWTANPNSSNTVYLANSGFSNSNIAPEAIITSTSSNTTPGASIGLALHNTDTTVGGYSPLLVFSKRESGASAYNSSIAAIGARTVTGTGASNSYIDGELIFYTAPTAGSGLLERMRIDQAGNAGIGTSSPTVKLDVAGELRVSGTGNTVMKGPVLLVPQGDLPMGEFTAGTNPASL